MVSHQQVPRVVSREQALALGYTGRAIDHRSRSGTWRRLLPRTYLTSDTLTPADRLDAALLFAGRGAALSGAAALRESGVRAVAPSARVLVLVPPDNRIDSYEFAQIRRTHRPIDIARRPGRRRVVPARATADRALELAHIDDVRALVARVVGDGHATLDALVAELVAGPQRGSALLRRALAEVGAGAASAPEARAATVLRRAGVPAFEQNAEIRLPNGQRYVADFLWRDLRAILEIDSIEYHLGPAQWRATMDRHLILTTLGYSVIHRPPSALRAEVAFACAVQDWLSSLSRVA